MKHSLKIIAVVVALMPSLASAALLSVSPASQSVKVGETITVSVRLDTQGASIDGVDIRHLNFNPRLLQVIDADAAKDGVQITAESLMELTIVAKADNETGKITFSQVAAGGTKYKGSGILATVKFKVVAPGTATLTFNHTPANTTDSNVAAAGKDILNNVINASYSITGTATQSPKTTTKTTQNVTTGTPIQEDPNAPIPETDTTPFEYSENKSFWQIIVSLVKDFFGTFTGRLSGN